MVRSPTGVAVIHIAKGALQLNVWDVQDPDLGEERRMPGAQRDPNHECMKLEAWSLEVLRCIRRHRPRRLGVEGRRRSYVVSKSGRWRVSQVAGQDRQKRDARLATWIPATP